jgi:hypothetical protein
MDTPGRYQLRSTIDAITNAALPLATGVDKDLHAAIIERARVQVEIADAVVALLDTKAQNGYTDAFYAVASMLGMPAMPTSPRSAWENEIEPRLRKLIAEAKAPRSVEDDLALYGVAYTVDGEVVHPSRVTHHHKNYSAGVTDGGYDGKAGRAYVFRTDGGPFRAVGCEIVSKPR